MLRKRLDFGEKRIRLKSGGGAMTTILTVSSSLQFVLLQSVRHPLFETDFSHHSRYPYALSEGEEWGTVEA